jgi:hypothetical protein
MNAIATSKTLRWVSGALFALALVVLLFHFSVYVAYAVNLIRFPFDYDQGEGFELVDVLMFSQGRFPYQDTETYPFYSSNYPPLFHLIPVPLMWAFGPQYWYGRLLSFLGTLVGAWLISHAVQRETQHRLIAALSGLAFLASNTVYHIGPLFRQHISMVIFETAAVVVLANAVNVTEPRKRWRQIAFGLALIIAAGYTKQLAALTAIAALGFLFVRNPRRAVIAGVGFALVGVLIFAWLTLGTNGEWWRQAIAANVNEYYPQQTTGLFRLWFRLHNALILPAVLLVLYELYFDRLSIYSVWFVVSLANGIASGAWGAGDSYFATTIAATSILSGIFLARTVQGEWRLPDDVYLSRVLRPLRRIAPLLTAASLIVVPLLYIEYGRDTLKLPTNVPVYREVASALGLKPNAPRWAEPKTFYDSAGRLVGGYADIGHFTTQADIDAGWQIVAMIREAEKPVITEDASFNLLAGEEVITNPTQLRNLWLNGLYSGDELVSMVEQQAFAFIVFRAQFYPANFLEAVSQHYAPDDDAAVYMNGFTYIIMRPQKPAP